MAARRLVNALVEGFRQMIAPRVCHVCGVSLTAGEDVLCLSCLLDLPRTYEHRSDFNEIHRRLGHHVQVDRAAGWFSYKKGTRYAHLLVDSKYGNKPKIDYHLGRMCAMELASERFFDGIEAVVPMPMHWWKRLRRGYNQAVEIADGISDVTSIPVCEALRAVKTHGTQAHHNKALRHTSIANTMDVNDPSAIQGKSILLVDDIITSGASCAEALRALSAATPSAISVLSLGLTSRDSTY